MYNPELEVLYQIGLGRQNLKTIAANSSMDKRKIVFLISNLERKGLLESQNPPQLSSHGLFELSKWLVNLQSGANEYLYWSHDSLPFFSYHNNLKKDALFYPNLFFDPAYTQDDTGVVYTASLLEADFSIENLYVLSNLLFEPNFLTPMGFWLLKYSQREICGWSITNFEKTMQLAGNPISMMFLFGCNEYVIIMSSRKLQKSFSKIDVKIYITRENCAYVDALDYVRDKLKPFLVFHKIQDFSKGREIYLETDGWWKDLPEPGLRIHPKVVGKIGYRDNKHEFDAITLVAILESKTMDTKLSMISPWLVTCPGSFDENKLSTGEPHRTHLFQVLNLPEIDIVTFMINSAR